MRLFDLAGILEGLAALLRATLTIAESIKTGKAEIDKPIYDIVEKELEKLGFRGPRKWPYGLKTL